MRPIKQPGSSTKRQVHTSVRALSWVFGAAEGKRLPSGIVEAIVRIEGHPVVNELIPGWANQMGISYLGIDMPGTSWRYVSDLISAGSYRAIINLIRSLTSPHMLLANAYCN